MRSIRSAEPSETRPPRGAVRAASEPPVPQPLSPPIPPELPASPDPPDIPLGPGHEPAEPSPLD